MPKISVGPNQYVEVDDIDWADLTFNYNSWCLEKGYPFTSKGFGIRKKYFRMHRIIGSKMGFDSAFDVDHEDGNPLNCCRFNLRQATHIQNRQNSRLRADSQTLYKGVKYDKRRGIWQARIQVNDKRLYLGTFSTPEAAAEAYRLAAIEHHGEFARY